MTAEFTFLFTIEGYRRGLLENVDVQEIDAGIAGISKVLGIPRPKLQGINTFSRNPQEENVKVVFTIEGIDHTEVMTIKDYLEKQFKEQFGIVEPRISTTSTLKRRR